MVKSYKSLVWDIETASADDLFRYGEGFIRLVGYQGDDDDYVITTDVNHLIDVIIASERHYGFNSLAFDCVALVVHHGADYLELTKNHVDLMLVERQVNPARAKTHYPKGYWGMSQ